MVVALSAAYELCSIVIVRLCSSLRSHTVKAKPTTTMLYLKIAFALDLRAQHTTALSMVHGVQNRQEPSYSDRASHVGAMLHA